MNMQHIKNTYDQFTRRIVICKPVRIECFENIFYVGLMMWGAIKQWNSNFGTGILQNSFLTAQ